VNKLLNGSHPCSPLWEEQIYQEREILGGSPSATAAPSWGPTPPPNSNK
jgi:hypothetical protein